MGNLNEEKKKRGIGNLGSEKMPYDYYEREYGTVPPDTKRKPFKWVSEVDLCRESVCCDILAPMNM